MNDIYSLLDLSRESIQAVAESASLVDDYEIQRTFRRNIRTLERIKDDMSLVGAKIDVPQDTVDQVIKKAVELSEQPDATGDCWTIRELRILSYHLSGIADNKLCFYFVLNLLYDKWRDMYFNGLTSSLLQAWNTMDRECRDYLCDLLRKKLEDYQGSNSRYMALRDHADLFSPQGPMRLCALLQAKGLNLREAPTVIGFKSSTFNLPYYSDVIVRYMDVNEVTSTETVDEVFQSHDLDRTKKLVLAGMVERAAESADDVQRALLCKYVNRTLGDVTRPTTWAPFTGATEDEVNLLERAGEMVKTWYTQEVIEAFFEVCVTDPVRKMFWLNYVAHIKRFRIVGSYLTKMDLRRDARIGDLVSSYFIQTASRSNTSALVLFMKDKMLVEFSDVGSLYVYNSHREVVNLVNNRPRLIRSINDLKDTSIGYLSDSWHWYGEGYIRHQGDWPWRFSRWMSIYILR